MTKFAMLLGGVALFAVSPVSAAVLVNGAPVAPLVEPNWTNQSNGQNFLVQFTLASASTITGFDIWMGSSFAILNDALRVKIRNDAGNSPATTNLFSFVDQVDAVSAFGARESIVSTNFAGITLNAGTYWFGVSGEGNTKTWASYGQFGPAPKQRQLSGDALVGTPGIGDLAFRVNGLVAAVPEPATWMMMLAGFGLVGGAMRRRTTTKVSFA